MRKEQLDEIEHVLNNQEVLQNVEQNLNRGQDLKESLNDRYFRSCYYPNRLLSPRLILKLVKEK